MKAKHYLKQIERLNKLIENKENECIALRRMAETITPLAGGDRVQNSSKHDKFERTIVKMVDLQVELFRDIEKLTELKREVMSVIDKLENGREIDLLYKRYVHLKRWEEIAVDMHYSIQGIYKLHGNALLKVQKILDETVE